MLSDLYTKAFEVFLLFTESEHPKSIGDPLVALFLLVCDLSINPTDGFPFNLYHFESFLESTDPGIRFYFLCRVIADKYPNLKNHITSYSKDEYIEVSEILSKAAVCKSPLSAAKKVVEWSNECPGLIELLKQGETFNFSDENLPIRIIFERFIRFCEDKVENPEFFCWTGAWTAGERCSEKFVHIFEKHQALFSDNVDGDIYPKSFPDKDEKIVSNAFNSFYAWIITYDLCRQWIVEEDQFRFFFYWLSNKYDLGTYRTWASDIFKSTFDVDPNDFEVL